MQRTRGCSVEKPVLWMQSIASLASAAHRAHRRHALAVLSLGWRAKGKRMQNSRRFPNYLNRKILIERTGGTQGWTVIEIPSTPGVPSAPWAAFRSLPERRRISVAHFASLRAPRRL